MKKTTLLTVICLFSMLGAEAQTTLHLPAPETESNSQNISTEITKHNLLSIYPNPAINMLVIETSSDKLNKIKVYDVLGNVLINENLNLEKRYEIDVTLFEKGVYFAEITTENNTSSIRKFNKQ